MCPRHHFFYQESKLRSRNIRKKTLGACLHTKQFDENGTVVAKYADFGGNNKRKEFYNSDGKVETSSMRPSQPESTLLVACYYPEKCRCGVGF